MNDVRCLYASMANKPRRILMVFHTKAEITH